MIAIKYQLPQNRRKFEGALKLFSKIYDLVEEKRAEFRTRFFKFFFLVAFLKRSFIGSGRVPKIREDIRDRKLKLRMNVFHVVFIFLLLC